MVPNHNTVTKKVADFRAIALEKLKDLYELSEAYTLINYILEDFLDLQLPKPSEVISDERWDKITSVVQRLSTGEPYQYITGKQLFAGLWLKVNPSVLIPRPETEELYELVKADRNKKGIKPKFIIDHCTGSGCLAIALKKAFPEAKVLATDVSIEALQVAIENAAMHVGEIQFHRIDLLRQTFVPPQSADLVISNPPYVSPVEASAMPINVYMYEPHLALFAPESDPLLFYRKILQSAIDYLNPGGLIALEINPQYVEELLKIASAHYTVEFKKDISGKIRFLFAHYPS
ncbi:peptide chain release factor N(5)-glutamine methyltransferase [Schleiferia thermophila]|uniref:peptide chain release factor N(5)-glutamine methyltransferase n=1 Tax=Schleiferia thermophila TaxID=884107 RepID=UPI003EEBD91C